MDYIYRPAIPTDYIDILSIKIEISDVNCRKYRSETLLDRRINKYQTRIKQLERNFKLTNKEARSINNTTVVTDTYDVIIGYITVQPHLGYNFIEKLYIKPLLTTIKKLETDFKH